MTLSLRSAPDQKDVLTLHIRSVGGWTTKLHDYFKEENDLIESERGQEGKDKKNKQESWRKK